MLEKVITIRLSYASKSSFLTTGSIDLKCIYLLNSLDPYQVQQVVVPDQGPKFSKCYHH